MIVNKYLLYILFIISVCQLQAQDTTAISEPPRIEEFVPEAVQDTVIFQDRAFSDGFKQKYDDDEFIYERKSTGESQWDRFKQWLANLLKDIFSFGDDASTATTIILRIVAALIVLTIVYFIVRAIIQKEGVWIFGRNRKKILATDAIAENIHEMDFGKLIAETKERGNHRLAIRFYYLWLLKKLSVREIIDWHFDKTNSDYLYEIKDTRLKKDFEYLSYLYDYSWYGEFPLDQASFSKAEQAFIKTLNVL